MTLLYKDYKKMMAIKTKILSGKIIHPTICMMEFLDKTREQPIDARLMICKEINEEAQFMINNIILQKHYKEEQNETPSKNKRL